jgi:hypothetical protein
MLNLLHLKTENEEKHNKNNSLLCACVMCFSPLMLAQLHEKVAIRSHRCRLPLHLAKLLLFPKWSTPPTRALVLVETLWLIPRSTDIRFPAILALAVGTCRSRG